jgi:hypothetical protein
MCLLTILLHTPPLKANWGQSSGCQVKDLTVGTIKVQLLTGGDSVAQWKLALSPTLGLSPSPCRGPLVLSGNFWCKAVKEKPAFPSLLPEAVHFSPG